MTSVQVQIIYTELWPKKGTQKERTQMAVQRQIICQSPSLPKDVSKMLYPAM